jgi:hypothetical protein
MRHMRQRRRLRAPHERVVRQPNRGTDLLTRYALRYPRTTEGISLMFRRIAIGSLSALAALTLVLGAYAQQNNIPPPNTPCSPYGTTAPAGQQSPTTIEPSLPIWCYTQPIAGPSTRVSGVNDWVDDWTNDGPAIQTLNNGQYDYRRFDFNSDNRIQIGQFVNVNHWMPDIADTSPYALSGGSMLSPNRSFHAENGRFVVELDGAAGSDGMGGADAFYEIDFSPSRPTDITVDNLYGYGQFGGQGAFGLRLERQSDGGHVVAAMYDNSTNGADCCPRGRIWETQGAGTALTGANVQGGYPQWPIPGTNLHVSDVWRQCADNELDLHCRDRFRVEVTKTTIDLYVNGYQVFFIHGLTANNPEGRDARIPDAYFSNFYSYATSWINSGQHHATRWHWDGFYVNRHNTDGTTFHAPDAYSSFCLGNTQPHLNTCADPAQPSATQTPVATPQPTTAPTVVPTATLVPATPTPLPTASPTSTATPAADVCVVYGARNGTPTTFPFACPPN